MVIELAAFLAVSNFNNGAKALMFVLEELNIDPGCRCIAACQKFDYDRICHSIRKSTEPAKKRRKHLRNWKKDILKLLKQEKDHLMRLVETVTKH